MFHDGVTVADMQTGLQVRNGNITGTLKKLTSGSLVDAHGEGYFMALKFTNADPNATSIKVGMQPSAGTGLVELLGDPDMDGGFKVTNKDTQKFVTITTVNGFTSRQEYNLSDLELEP